MPRRTGNRRRGAGVDTTVRLLRLTGLVVALAAVLLSPAATGAATKLSAKLRTPARGLTAEQPWTAVVEVRRDGRLLRVGGVSLLVRDTSGAVRTFRARAAGPGLYRARVVFPWAARWTIAVRAQGQSVVLARAGVRAKPPGPEPVTISAPAQLVALPDGSLLVVEDGLSRVVRVNPSTGAVSEWQRVDDTYGIALGPDGSVFVTSGLEILRIDPAGRRSSIARFDVDIGPLAVNAAGTVFVATARQQIVRIDPATGATAVYAGTGVGGAAGDGGPATAAQIQGVHGLAVGADGALYLADTGNDRVRRIDAANGRISTVATAPTPVGAARGPDGSIYFTSAPPGHRVHRIAPSGEVTVVAGNGRGASTGDGGPATAASLMGPAGITVDAAGNVYVAEFDLGRLRMIDPGGTITTLVRR
jgi:streptogramin lyase